LGFHNGILGTEDKELPADGEKGIIPLEMPLFVRVAEGSEYYDFRYPNADKLMIVADAQWTDGTDTFNIKLPSDFLFYDRSYSHYAYDSDGSTMKIDGK
jgi:hypothetical protein